MAKKIILCLVIFAVAGGVLFSQTAPSNNVSLLVGIIGAEGSYERMFNRHLSVLGSVSYSNLILANEFTVSGKGRVYPFGKTFYLEMGLGYAYGRSLSDAMGDIILGVLTFGWWLTQIDEERLAPNGGFMVQPGLGWKIKLGRDSRLSLPIGMGLDFKMVKIDESGKLPDAFPWLRIGVGYAF